MKCPLNFRLWIVGLLLMVAAASQAQYYRLFGRGNIQIFFGPMDNKQIDEIGGVKFWTGEAKGENDTDYAVGRIDVKFGNHKGTCFAEGLFSNSYAEARTEEDITFSNSNGGSILVRVNLKGVAALAHPATVSVQRAESTLFINGESRVFYRDRYIGNSHEVIPAQAYFLEVANGATIRLKHQTIFQISGTGSSDLYFVSCNGGIQAEVTVLTKGASMKTSSGARYKPWEPRGPAF